MKDFQDVGGLGQHLNRLSPEEKSIRLAAFYRILGGRSSTTDDFSLETGITVKQVQQYIKNMVRQGILVVNEQGAVVGSHGLSIIPTEHRLRVAGQDLFTWCAVDAVGIPAALGVDATITSNCFQCNETIEIRMITGQVQHSKPADTRIWVTEADLGRSIVGCA